MDLIKRKTIDDILSYISDGYSAKPVLVISGARQTGKTTLIKEAIGAKPHIYMNFEVDRSLAERVDSFRDFKEFEIWLKDEFSFNSSTHILCIDEAQYSQTLGRFVGAMKEQWQGASVIITGSLVSELYNSTQRRPVGRETYLDLWPLTFEEVLAARGYNELVKILRTFKLGDKISLANHERFLDAFDVYLKVGGLPEVVTYYLDGRDYKKRRCDIFQAYQDDFVRYYSHEDVSLFKRCLSAVAQNVGSPSKDSQVVRPNVPAYKKVAGIYSRLEQWKVIIKYDQLGFRPEQNKLYPKRYLYDLGVLRDLRLGGFEEVGVRDLAQTHLRTPLGGIVENAVALSLQTQFGSNVFGVQLAGQSEIDFAVKQGERVFPIECKMSLRFKENYLQGLQKYLSEMTREGTGFLLYGGPPLAEQKSGCWALPYYLVDEMERLVGYGRGE